MAGGWGDALDASAYLDLSLSVVRRLTRRGALKGYRVGSFGKLVRYRRADCDQFLLDQQIAVPITSRGRR